MIHKLTLAEALADYMVAVGCDSATASEALAERFIEDVVKSENIEPTYEESDLLYETITDLLDGFSEDAELLVNEWNDDARAMEDDRRRGLSGRY